MMLAANPYGGVSQAFEMASGPVKADVGKLLNHQQYYATPEVSRELRHIDNGINHIRLDNSFLESSRDWPHKFNHATLATEKQGAIRCMNHAAAVVHDLRNQTSNRNTGNMKDNQVREQHQWSVQNLQSLEKDLGPYAHASADRIRQYCDHLGVTNRYVGYRHNLNRANQDPARVGQNWLSTQRNGHNASLNVQWQPTVTNRPLTHTSNQFGVPPTYAAEQVSHRATHSAPPGSVRHSTGGISNMMSSGQGRTARDGPTKSIQQQCGINTTFPGQTEYIERYAKPNKDGNVTGFMINPAPNYYLPGRPLQSLHPPLSFTEYQNRYAWPDSEKIPRLPWLRK